MFKKAQYVYAVYREASFTKAAQSLFVSQPCLSAAIRQIEQKIGAPLFERSAASVKPTELGLEYIKTAEQILSLEAQFLNRVKDVNSLTYGTVRVGGSNYISSYILPRIIDTFSRRYPDVVVSLTEANSTELNDLLQSEAIDLIIDSFDEAPSDISYYPLSQEKILLAVPDSYSSNSHDLGVSPGDIFESQTDCTDLPAVPIHLFRQEKFILLKSGNSMYEHAMDIFRSSGITPRVSLFLDQLSTSNSLTAQGNGCCFVTDTIFRYHKYNDPVRLYNIAGSKTRTLAIAHKKRRHITPAVTKFIEICQNNF